uniref:Uncharacterized protein n=1 Tax=Tetradesmus obliquus TaxID=3088 RepID=A0A383VTP0_TETOB|eukprot:jgi/Sobl393_1/3167/SZX68868.1
MMQLLQPLAQMPALQHLVMEVDKPRLAAAAAAAWAQLPQLGGLVVAYFRDPVSRQQWEAIRSGLAAATSLTQLDLSAVVDHHAHGKWHKQPVAACGALAGLTKLRDLHIRRSSRLVTSDARQLTKLTGLTRLVLAGIRAGVGSRAAAALARSCRQLRHLDLSECTCMEAHTWMKLAG